jgi:hypothetical protein
VQTKKRTGQLIFIFTCPFFVFVIQAQELKRSAFRFLDVPSNARFAAMGGVNVSLADRDPNAFFSNPALVSDTLSGYASANYQFYVADIGHAAFTYLPVIKKIGMVSFGVQHFNYGTIKAYDASGNELGDYSAGETAIVISKSHQIGVFRLGASLKPVFSSLAGYRASALLFDLGGVFVHPVHDLKIGLVIRNVGFLMQDYSETNNTLLPLDVQFGSSFKPKHMPFRFSVAVYRLVQPESVNYVGNIPDNATVLDKVFRHFNFGTEVLLHKNVNLLLGYNYGIHRELKLEEGGGAAGFSFGFSARIKTMELVFSRSTYVTRSAAYSFTLSADLKRMLRRS